MYLLLIVIRLVFLCLIGGSYHGMIGYGRHEMPEYVVYHCRDTDLNQQPLQELYGTNNSVNREFSWLDRKQKIKQMKIVYTMVWPVIIDIGLQFENKFTQNIEYFLITKISRFTVATITCECVVTKLSGR